MKVSLFLTNYNRAKVMFTLGQLLAFHLFYISNLKVIKSLYGWSVLIICQGGQLCARGRSAKSPTDKQRYGHMHLLVVDTI